MAIRPEDQREVVSDFRGNPCRIEEALVRCHNGSWTEELEKRDEIDSQRHWRLVAQAGGCSSKAQSIAVKLFLNQGRDGSIPLRDSSVPRGRKFEWIAETLNRMGLRTESGETWKRTRTQQVVFEGLAWQMTFAQLHQLKMRGRGLDEAFEECLRVVWQVFRRKRVSRRTCLRKAGLVCDKPKKPINWAAKKRLALENGWRPSSRYWYLD